MAEIKIDHDIPIPENLQIRYSWNKMDVGDSFLVPDRKLQSVKNAATSQARRNGRKYSVRVCDMTTGDIDTVGEFQGYDSLKAAERAASREAGCYWPE